MDRHLGAARSGDQGSFGIIVDAVTVRLCLFIRRNAASIVGGDCDADDLFQSTVARAWNLLPAFVSTGPDSFYRWLVALARGVMSNRRDYLAHKGRGGVRHIDSVVEGGAARAAFDPTSSISSLVARREETRTLERILAAMDPDDRRLIERSVLEGASVSEIAGEAGLSRSTAWDRLTRAMDDLRRRAAVDGTT